MPCRLMVGQQPLELFIVVRIHAGQQFIYLKMGRTVRLRRIYRGFRQETDEANPCGATCGMFMF